MRKETVPIVDILSRANSKEIFAPGADWHTGNALGAGFSLPQRYRLMSARNAMQGAPLSMLPVIRLTAGDPVILIRAYSNRIKEAG